MKLSVVIAEDEEPALLKLRKMLREQPGVEVTAEARDGTEALRLIETLRPDAAFLDIRMPGGDGLSVAALLQPAPKIVFVTAHAGHAASAFECEAFDYLLKPYTVERVRRLVSRLKTQIKLERMARWLQTGAQVAPHPEQAPAPAVVLKLPGEIVSVPVSSIECVIAEGNYLHLMTAGRKFFVRGTLASLAGTLPASDFIRVHRCGLVNLRRISSASTEQRMITTASGYLVPISDARLPQVSQTLLRQGLPTLGTRKKWTNPVVLS